MPRKCSAGYCKSNYDSTKEKVPVYGFPPEESERKRWLDALPNKIDKVTRYIGICSKHWPDSAEMIQTTRFSRPRDPPSIFPNCPSSMIKPLPKPRNLPSRKIEAASRSAISDEWDDFQRKDQLPEFTEFFQVIQRSDIVQSHNLCVTFDSSRSFIILSHFRGEMTDYSIHIYSNYHVKALRFRAQVDVRDLMGFQCRIETFSQVEAIVNRVKNTVPDIPSSIANYVSEIETLLDLCGDIDCTDRQRFLLRQLLYSTSKKPHEFSTGILKTATELLVNGRRSYEAFRRILTLPHHSTISKYFGGSSKIGTIEGARETLNFVLSKYSGLQQKVCIMFDEVYIKASVRYRGNHVVGWAEDDPTKVARTVLAFMVKPLMTSESFVIRLVPVFSLTSDFLQHILINVIDVISECGGDVFALICDCAAINRKVYKILRKSPEEPWIGQHPVHSQEFYLLYDTVHLMKSMRNNWISEKTKEINIELDGNEVVTGKWSDVIELYKKESGNIVRRTKLCHEACFPSSFDLQKVALALNVFNDKTVAALTEDSKTNTAKFVSIILQFWKIVNVKHPESHIYLNDSDKKPFTDLKDQRFVIMKKLSESVAKMPGNQGATRIKSFTTITRDSLVQSINGLISLTKKLLEDRACRFVLLGMFQTDPLEGEFGIYRQSSGGNYLIGFEQILSTAQNRRLALFARLADAKSELQTNQIHPTADCCESDVTEDELETVDNIFRYVDMLTDDERNALFYVCGYVEFKLRTSEELSDRSDTKSTEYVESSDFTHLVSRGKLTFPSEKLFNFSLMCYAFFKQQVQKCAVRCRQMFIVIHDCFFCDAPITNIESVCKRLTNIFYKGLVTMKSDLLKQEDRNAMRKRKFKVM